VAGYQNAPILERERMLSKRTLTTETTMKTLTILILGLAGLALSSCNAVAGAGQDLEEGGEAMTHTAREVAY
jgi:predicted small secreted protein